MRVLFLPQEFFNKIAYFVEKLCVASVKELDFRKSDKGCRLIADLDLLSLCIWPDLDHPEALRLSCGGPQQVHRAIRRKFCAVAASKNSS